jgi:hypothetical protein
MLSVINKHFMLIMQRVIMLNVLMLSVVMKSVMVPLKSVPAYLALLSKAFIILTPRACITKHYRFVMHRACHKLMFLSIASGSDLQWHENTNLLQNMSNYRALQIHNVLYYGPLEPIL